MSVATHPGSTATEIWKNLDDISNGDVENVRNARTTPAVSDPTAHIVDKKVSAALLMPYLRTVENMTEHSAANKK